VGEAGVSSLLSNGYQPNLVEPEGRETVYRPLSSDVDSAAVRFPDGTGRPLQAVVEESPPGQVIELAPGRYVGALSLRRAITLRGAGDLSCIAIEGSGSAVLVDAGDDRVILESLRIEGGDAESGGALRIDSGRVKAHNLHLRHCRAKSGGAIHLKNGDLDATLLRIEDVVADRGGAVWIEGKSALSLRDSQVSRSEAGQGGALCVEGGARVVLEGVTVRRARALSPAGGQALFVAGNRDAVPTLYLRRVRLEDVPFGAPLIVDGRFPGEISLFECDMPRVVLDAPGVVDGGSNHWR
jgi:hypothetical protein